MSKFKPNKRVVFSFDGKSYHRGSVVAHLTNGSNPTYAVWTDEVIDPRGFPVVSVLESLIIEEK